jgi:hypothetical protein
MWGYTPGYKVSFRAQVDVLPFPLPRDFAFPLPDTPGGSESTLGHGQNLIMGGVVNRIYSEEDAAEIRAGRTKRLYIYGTANYEDAYHIQRYTSFVSVLFGLETKAPWASSHNATMTRTRKADTSLRAAQSKNLLSVSYSSRLIRRSSKSCFGLPVLREAPDNAAGELSPTIIGSLAGSSLR